MKEDKWFDEADSIQSQEEMRRSMLPSASITFGVWDLRFGRGFVALGAILAFAAFSLPSFRIEGDEHRRISALLLSMQASQLWNIPVVACVLIYILVTRRNAMLMQRARMAVIILGLIPMSSLLYVFFSMRHRFEELANKGGISLRVFPDLGLLIAFISMVTVLYGGLRFSSAANAAPNGEKE
jgi:hypothetical protein